MADTNEAEEQPQIVFCALPELHDPQSTAITAEVDTLLQTIMEMAQVTIGQLQEFVGRFGQRSDPEFLLERKKHFLAALSRKRKVSHSEIRSLIV